MKVSFCVTCLLLAASWVDTAAAADIDARPPDRLTLNGSGSRQLHVDDGGGASLNWLHYFTPDAIFGLGGEHQFISDAKLNFGSVRGAWSTGAPGSRWSILGEANIGQGNDGKNDYDYSVVAVGVSRALSTKFYVELEEKQFDIDTTHGSLPKLGLTYVWSPHLLTYVSYAYSIGGNLGTKLTSARIEYYLPQVTLKAGGATGRADPSVLVNDPLLGALPAVKSKQGFIGVGKTFKRGEVQLISDYLKTGDSKKITVTLSLTAYLGNRGRSQ
jgi:hypothetical protein